MHLVRPIIDGELWWSAIARHFDLTGINRPSIQSRLLVGNKRSTGSPTLPRQVLIAAASMAVPLTGSEIIQKHTALPFYAAFLDPEKVARARRTMLSNGHTEFQLGLAAMHDYPRWLRACPQCSTHDCKVFGCTPWRTMHQLPGVNICPIHFVPLIESNVSARATAQIRQYETARQSGVLEGQRRRAPSTDMDLRWFAQSAKQLLEWKGTAPGHDRLATLYRNRLVQKGYIESNGRIAVTMLTEDFNMGLSPFLHQVGHPTPRACDRTNWLIRLLRPRDSDLSPVCHLAMLRFLEIDPLTSVEMAASLPRVKPMQCRPFVAAVRTSRITTARVSEHRAKWQRILSAKHKFGHRNRNDSLYSWLWRNDRAWLKQSQQHGVCT